MHSHSSNRGVNKIRTNDFSRKKCPNIIDIYPFFHNFHNALDKLHTSQTHQGKTTKDIHSNSETTIFPKRLDIK